MAAFLLHNVKQPGRVGNGARDTRRRSHSRERAPLPTLQFIRSRYSHPLSSSLLSTSLHSYSQLPNEGRAERRWRSDACEAPVSARHDRRADASSICASPGKSPPCVRCAPRASPGLRSICANRATTRLVLAAHRASPTCGMRRLAFPATGRSPFGAPRGISGPGPCSPLSGSPSRIVRQPHMPHGSSLPGGAGLANLPGAAANRLRGHHSLAPPCRIASGGSPLERGWMVPSISY